MIPMNEPKLSGGEGLLSCAMMNAIPSPDTVELDVILMVKVVEKDAGHARIGYRNRTLPTSLVSFGRSGVMFRLPLPEFTDPQQIRLLPFSQLAESNDEKEKFCDSTKLGEVRWIKKIRTSINNILVRVHVS